jgi:hypothetical protein
MAERDELSHAEIKARTLGSRPASRAVRTQLIAAGNQNVLEEAADVSRGGAPSARAPGLRSGPAWRSGMKAWGGVEHHPGKQDTPDIGRLRKPITY